MRESFPALTPAEIYRRLTEGPGTVSMSQAQEATARECSAEDERATLVSSLANAIKAGWQGEAGAGAYGAAMPPVERAFENTAKLDRSQELLARQIDSFHTARNSVVPVDDPPEMPIGEKFPFDVDHEKSVQEYRDRARNNITVFRAYDDASQYNETQLPSRYGDERVSPP